MLREFLISEFILSPTTGLGNKAVSGFFFDDGWTVRGTGLQLGRLAPVSAL